MQVSKICNEKDLDIKETEELTSSVIANNPRKSQRTHIQC